MRRRDVEHLYSEHGRQLLSFLVYRLGDQATAEDVLAETFESALRAPPLLKTDERAARAWLYTTALNRARDGLRRSAAEGRALQQAAELQAGEGSAGAEEHVTTRDMLRQALAKLSEEEREALALRFGADLTVPEIAELTGQSLTTVEGRVYRALRKLRDQLPPGALH